MANTFKTHTFDGGSTAADTDMLLYTCPASTQTTIIGMTIANTTSSQVTVDVLLESDTTDGSFNNDNVHLLKDAPVPAGSSLVPIGGDQKIVLEPDDKIKVQSDTANSVDITLSFLEIT